jgi:hypothetical protein
MRRRRILDDDKRAQGRGVCIPLPEEAERCVWYSLLGFSLMEMTAGGGRELEVIATDRIRAQGTKARLDVEETRLVEVDVLGRFEMIDMRETAINPLYPDSYAYSYAQYSLFLLSRFRSHVEGCRSSGIVFAKNGEHL